ncbi:MAG: hypothetical protein EBZ59_10940, partial [Planctomycetia bacterium]|nr:hypothetical protein [Planctomycetia bacterium]
MTHQQSETDPMIVLQRFPSQRPCHGRPARAAAILPIGLALATVAIAWSAAAPAAGPAAPPADPATAAFETLARDVLQNPTAATEQQVLEMVATAERLGRPYAANLALKAWLARNTAPSPAVLLAAA